MIYNQKNQDNINNLMTIQRHQDILTIHYNSIVLGDFNNHHPNWDPHYPKSSNADNLLEWLEMQGLSLTNDIGQGTFYRTGMDYPSVLDLSLVTRWSERFIQD